MSNNEGKGLQKIPTYSWQAIRSPLEKDYGVFSDALKDITPRMNAASFQRILPLDSNHHLKNRKYNHHHFSFLLLFSFCECCEFVDNVNTGRGELWILKGFEAYRAIQSSASFSEKVSNRNLGWRPIIKVLIILRKR